MNGCGNKYKRVVVRLSIPTISYEKAALFFRAMNLDPEAIARVAVRDIRWLIHRANFGDFLDANRGHYFNVMEGGE
jgi:hypothetical protein